MWTNRIPKSNYSFTYLADTAGSLSPTEMLSLFHTFVIGLLKI